MSKNEDLCLTPDQLMQLINLFYSPNVQNREEIDQLLLRWVQSPSSMSLAFEIIQSSNNKKLRFFASCSFHYLIINNYHLLSDDDLNGITDLFSSFVMNNQDIIDSPDTKYILTTLADLFFLFNNFIDIFQLKFFSF